MIGADSFHLLPGDPASPVVLHVPHSSRHVPADVRDRILLDDAGLQHELDTMTDAHTDLIAGALATRLPTAPWQLVNRTSRLVVDPERFPDPAQEEMSAVGMGAVYTRTSTGVPLREPDPEHEEHLLGRDFNPYSGALSERVQQRLEAVGRVLVVDVHSYPAQPLPYELHQTARRPAVCLGVDGFHTPASLLRVLTGRIDDLVVNEPFAGCYVPLRHYRSEPAVSGVMLELRRDTYSRHGIIDQQAVGGLATSLAEPLTDWLSG